MPIWVAVGGTTESVIRAAKLGLPVMFAIIGGSPVNFKPLFEIYEQAFVDSGHKLEDMQVGVHMHAFFGEDTAGYCQMVLPLLCRTNGSHWRLRGWPAYQPAV